MTRQERIVALVDGSVYSASVCAHAAWIAGRTGAPVELIHVLGWRLMTMRAPSRSAPSTSGIRAGPSPP